MGSRNAVRGTKQKRLRARARQATERLAREYGSPDHGNKSDPLDELVFILLSQMTTQPSFGRVFDRLKRRFPTWERARRAGLRSFKVTISDAGLSNQKAPRILGILSKVREDFGETSLASLCDLPDAEVEEYLTSLPGVGTKTAKCVMMYALKREVLPVDAHVWRVSRRLGLVGTDVPYARIHDVLEPIVPGPLRYDFHVNALAHGRAVCKAIKPRCVDCVLNDLCDHYAGRQPP